MPKTELCLQFVRNGHVNGENFEKEREILMENTTTATTPRSVIIVPWGKSQASCRRVTPTPVHESSGANVVEKHLPNGDFYMGYFSNNMPHGLGKYLWQDGCMYEGEWKKGKASGKGKFSWPSGATFEGEFRSGRMEGNGTFIGPAGDIYKGFWSGDRKHGYGVKHYCNGDYYEGHWKRNLQDGHGRYLWRNGNEYIGEWKNGVIHGKGVLVFDNGNRYDGDWENGVPKGHGVFTWSDDQSKNGNRTQILNETLYAPHNFENGTEEDLMEGFCRKLSAPLMVVGEDSLELVIGGDEGEKRSSSDDWTTEKAFPRICIWEADDEAGDITCDFIDNIGTSMPYGNGFLLNRDGIRRFLKNPFCIGEEAKKPGETISKGHKNYDLMLNLQLGIRHSVGKHTSITRDLKLSDFDPKEKFWTRFPPEGSKTTPPHPSVEFRWKDYCPMVFRHLRELFQVDSADYMLAICGSDALRELSSPGKSGSFFYLTQDDRFMIKTVKKSEVKVLTRMLSSYYQHMCRYGSSILTKFYGVHCIKPVGGYKTRFIVMGNMFCSEFRIDRRFDLKGSSYGRSTDKPVEQIDETTTLKDLDLNFIFRLQTSWHQKLSRQIDRDCEFLEGEGIMDYSLLVGLHFRNDSTGGDHMGTSNSFRSQKLMRGCRFIEAEQQNMDWILAGRKPSVRLGANMPAQAERVGHMSDFDQYSRGKLCHMVPSSCSGEIYETILYFGIIDILQDYDISKRLEHAYKSLQIDSTSISAVDPKHYSKRFRDFIQRIFIEDR